MKKYNYISCCCSEGYSELVESEHGDLVYFEPWMENNWIPVEKELPPVETELWVWNGTNVLVYHLSVGLFDDLERRRTFLRNMEITHWMIYRRPQPPKRGGKEE